MSRQEGDIALRSGEANGAARAYALAALRAPNDPVLRLLTGVSLTTARKSGAAVTQFRAACRLTGDDLVATLLLQGALAQSGQADAAQTVYLDAVRRYSKPGGGLDSSASLTLLKNALKTAPRSPILHLLVGDAYQIAENLSEADAAYRAAIQLAPGWAKPKVNLGLLRLAQNKPTSAVVLFQAALARDPENTELMFFNADAQRQAGNLNGAITIYRNIQNSSAASKTPAVAAQALTGIGQAYAAGGHYDDALAVLNKARVIAPGDPAPPTAIGEVQNQRRDYNAAARNYSDALRLTKASGLFGARTVLYQALAQTQIADGQAVEARKTLERALRDEPEGAGLWHRLLGESLLATGNQTGAEKEFRASLDAQTDVGEFPQETLATIAAKGLLDTVASGYRADFSPNHFGFATGAPGSTGTVSITGRGDGAVAPPAPTSRYANSMVLGASLSTRQEREIRAFAALAAIAQYRGDTAEEIANRKTLAESRARSADFFALADAYDGRARDEVRARDAYQKALKAGGLTEAQAARARLRVRQLGDAKP